MRRILWLTGALLVLVVVLVSVHFSTTDEEFSRFNIQWNGTSAFFEGFGAAGGTEITELSALDTTHASRLLVIAPYRTFTVDDIAHYRGFLEQGHTLVLADDYGTGNQLLSGLGSSIRILPGNLTSINREYADSSSVITYPVRNDTLVGNVSTLVLNHPAAVEGGEELVTTSLLSWLDTDGDGRAGPDEELGRYAVLSREQVGTGTLYVLSDPSVFINAMAEDSGDNRVFLDRLVTGPGRIAIDQTHGRTSTDDFSIRISRAVAESLPARLLIVSILIVIVAYLFRRGQTSGDRA
jgi:hypothetical protein